MKRGWKLLLVGGIALVVILSIQMAAAGTPQMIREEGRSAGVIRWSCSLPFAGAHLDISGPGDFHRSLRFASTENLFLNTEGLADGGYRYQLTVQPVVGDAVKDSERVENRGLNRGSELQAMEPLGGFFRILDGRIIADTKLAESSSSAVGLRTEVEKADVLDDSDGGSRDNVILDDLIVDGSACVGFDCVNGESFGYDTIRLKENNLRIRFYDTSSSASFPTNDWQLTANDSSNGGRNMFSIDDIDGGRTPFMIEAGARTNSLYIDDYGRIGMGTSTPSAKIHAAYGDTPTLRLDQDGSGGWSPQIWDVAGNEANFFIRDVNHGSKLPFRIRPGAPTSSIDIAAGGDVGIGTALPSASLHVYGNDGDTQLKVEEASGTSTGRILLNLINNGGAQFRLENTTAGVAWKFVNNNSGLFSISDEGDGIEFQMTPDGNVTIAGNLTVRNGQADETTYPDFVFSPDYSLMGLGELSEFVQANRHLPEIPTAETMAREGINMTEMQLKLLKKVEELTLYLIEQENRLGAQQQELERLKEQLASVKALSAGN